MFPVLKYRICLMSFSEGNLYDGRWKKGIVVPEDAEALTRL
jgi:hypothetical protein